MHNKAWISIIKACDKGEMRECFITINVLELGGGLLKRRSLLKMIRLTTLRVSSEAENREPLLQKKRG